MLISQLNPCMQLTCNDCLMEKHFKATNLLGLLRLQLLLLLLLLLVALTVVPESSTRCLYLGRRIKFSKFFLNSSFPIDCLFVSMRPFLLAFNFSRNVPRSLKFLKPSERPPKIAPAPVNNSLESDLNSLQDHNALVEQSSMKITFPH